MLGVSESNVSSQTSRGAKRKWVPEEDAALVSYMVDLHNVGTFNADTGLLKRDWSIVYDMLNGQNNSGFDWDEHRQLVVAEDAVWNSYLNDVPTTYINEERNEFYDCEADVSLDDMDVSATEP
ncbi:hypothetical protein Gotur_020030, partial [Gossypium turneri]